MVVGEVGVRVGVAERAFKVRARFGLNRGQNWNDGNDDRCDIFVEIPPF
jgi:hypothetical protein